MSWIVLGRPRIHAVTFTYVPLWLVFRGLQGAIRVTPPCFKKSKKVQESKQTRSPQGLAGFFMST